MHRYGDWVVEMTDTGTARERDAVRLVVTGHDQDGTGRVVSDQLIGPKKGLAADGWRAYVLWGVDQLPALPDGGDHSFEGSTPGRGAVRFVQLDVLPAGAHQSLDSDPSELKGIQRPTGDHSAGIHYTSTVDLLVVLEGEATLELDGGKLIELRQGDYLVQNGTRHAWHNFSDRPARLGVIVLGAEHAGFD
jgi:mannose-6-phosphate isomerase-like protein (cupin superfamily)